MKLLRTWATLLLPAAVCAGHYGNQGNRTDVVEIWNVPTASPAGIRIEVPPRLAIRGLVVSAGLQLEVR